MNCGIDTTLIGQLSVKPSTRVLLMSRGVMGVPACRQSIMNELLTIYNLNKFDQIQERTSFQDTHTPVYKYSVDGPFPNFSKTI